MSRIENTSNWQNHFRATLNRLQELDRLRCRGGQPQQAEDALNFASNDYLGLRSHPVVLATMHSEAKPQVWGSGASPVLNGWQKEHGALERDLAELSGTSSALVFSSGYSANMGTLAALLSPDDIVFSDSLNHACLIDGMRLTKATRVIYPHRDVDSLRNVLQQRVNKSGRRLIVTESVFSMDGDRAPLESITQLAEDFDCGLVVDEAHATGIYGIRGGGLLEELNLQAAALLKLGTLSKALGGIGGFVAGSDEAIEFLVNTCRSYLFSTSPPPQAMQTAQSAIKIARTMQCERECLRSNSVDLREQLRRLDLTIIEGDSPIIPVIIGPESKTISLSNMLAQAGLNVPAIRPPTVPPGECRLRISLSVNHSPDDLQRLLDGMKTVSKSL